MFRRKLPNRQDAELDITSFMSLMIVLVPVLLMMMVFSHITVMQLRLPPILAGESAETLERKELQLAITNQSMTIYYPAGAPLKQFIQVDGQFPYADLQQALKDVKNLLLEKGVDKKDITLLIAQDVDYQTLISVMETVRSYQAVVVASVVEAELFPDIALADAPKEAL